MSDNIAELIAVLEEKRHLLESMQSILENERKLIVELKAAEVEQLNSRKEELIEGVNRLNKRFQSVLRKTSREMQLPEESSLSPLIARLNRPEKDCLQNLQNGLITVSGKIGELAAVNKGLLENSLRFIERSMTFFGRFFKKNDTYGVTGRMTESSSGSRLVCKEI